MGDSSDECDLSGGSRPGHKVSGTRSKFPNLNENGQNLILRWIFLTQNPVKIVSRSATEPGCPKNCNGRKNLKIRKS